MRAMYNKFDYIAEKLYWIVNFLLEWKLLKKKKHDRLYEHYWNDRSFVGKKSQSFDPV
jgi:hypothetical protein